MSNVVKMIFGNRPTFDEYSDNLTWADCLQRENALTLNSLHLIIVRYQTLGKHLDPDGSKAMAAARLYKLLIASGDDRIGVSQEFGLECLEDLERLQQVSE